MRRCKVFPHLNIFGSSCEFWVKGSCAREQSAVEVLTQKLSDAKKRDEEHKRLNGDLTKRVRTQAEMIGGMEVDLTNQKQVISNQVFVLGEMRSELIAAEECTENLDSVSRNLTLCNSNVAELEDGLRKADIAPVTDVLPSDMDLIDVSAGLLLQLAVEAFGGRTTIVDDHKVSFGSRVYKVPLLEDVHAFHAWTGVGVAPTFGKQIYVPELHDCEKFAFDFFGQACHYRNIYGLSIGYLGVMTALSWHGINAVFARLRSDPMVVSLYFYEPQNRDYYPIQWAIEIGMKRLTELNQVLQDPPITTPDMVLGKLIL